MTIQNLIYLYALSILKIKKVKAYLRLFVYFGKHKLNSNFLKPSGVYNVNF